jgi:hypothetical protein
LAENFSISILLPVINETYSLEKTVEIIIDENLSFLKEIIVLVSEKKTNKKSFEVINSILIKYPNTIKMVKQDLPFLGGAIRKGFDVCNGSHVILMASDFETNPYDVKKLISYSKKNKTSIITTSRWISGGSFKNYNYVKLILNFIFQNILRIIFLTRYTDLTYGFRLFPTQIIKNIEWSELRHAFLLESILKPLKMKVDIIEIPTKWSARTEGVSQNSFMLNFIYIKTAFKIKFFWKV